MKQFNWFGANVIFIILVLIVSQTALASEFALSSPQIKDNQQIGTEQVYNGFGCTGSNVSPALNWTHLPAGTKSLALTVFDPDAPTGSGWWHWVIFNIDPEVSGLPANAGNVKAKLAPAGSVQSRTDFGMNGYGGPCPPAGDKPHRYIFTLFALNVKQLPLDETTPAAMVGFFLNQHRIQKTQMTVLYARQN
jgi:Raf kinase inhibitor-like YbhB/YbcL family protein